MRNLHSKIDRLPIKVVRIFSTNKLLVHNKLAILQRTAESLVKKHSLEYQHVKPFSRLFFFTRGYNNIKGEKGRDI